MYVAVDGGASGLAAVADRIRESVRQAVTALHAMNAETMMPAGDYRNTVQPRSPRV